MKSGFTALSWLWHKNQMDFIVSDWSVRTGCTRFFFQLNFDEDGIMEALAPPPLQILRVSAKLCPKTKTRLIPESFAFLMMSSCVVCCRRHRNFHRHPWCWPTPELIDTQFQYLTTWWICRRRIWRDVLFRNSPLDGVFSKFIYELDL